jgi:hypothetical protein
MAGPFETASLFYFAAGGGEYLFETGSEEIFWACGGPTARRMPLLGQSGTVVTDWLGLLRQPQNIFSSIGHQTIPLIYFPHRGLIVPLQTLNPRKCLSPQVQ